MPKSAPLRDIAVTREEPATPRAGSATALPRAIATFRKKLVVAGDEGEDGGERLPVLHRAREGGGKLAKQQAGAGDVALVHLVAGREPARHDALQGNAAAAPKGCAESRPEDLRDPAKPPPHLGVVAAEAHHLAEPLVDGAVRPVPERPVLDHHHRHPAGDDAGHRPHRVVMVVGREVEAAPGRERLRLVEVSRPPLEHRRPRRRPPHRAAHPAPFDGRPGVKEQAVAHTGHRIARGEHVDENRVAAEHPIHRLPVRRLDPIAGGAGAGLESVREREGVRVRGGRRPLHFRHLDPGGAQVGRELLQTDVHDPDGPGQQILQAKPPVPPGSSPARPASPPSGSGAATPPGSESRPLDPRSRGSRSRSS